LKLELFPIGIKSISCILGPGDRGGGGYIDGRRAGDVGRGLWIFGTGVRGGFGDRGARRPSVESLRCDLNLGRALSSDKSPNMDRIKDTRDGRLVCVIVGDIGSAGVEYE
jgi:hypothetical protein